MFAHGRQFFPPRYVENTFVAQTCLAVELNNFRFKFYCTYEPMREKGKKDP